MRKVVKLYWNFAEGSRAKAQGTTAIVVGAVGKFGGMCLYIYRFEKKSMHFFLRKAQSSEKKNFFLNVIKYI